LRKNSAKSLPDAAAGQRREGFHAHYSSVHVWKFSGASGAKYALKLTW
jgi:hypothetical protein